MIIQCLNLAINLFCIRQRILARHTRIRQRILGHVIRINDAGFN